MIFMAVWLTVIPFNVFGHGTEYRLIFRDNVVAAEFLYSDKTPMQYAEILVFSPESETVEYQNGRTDQNGRFAFLPETSGTWKMEVSDGMGHAVYAEVTVPSLLPELKENGESYIKQIDTRTANISSLVGGSPMVIKIVLGLSILLNIFLAVSMKKRQT